MTKNDIVGSRIVEVAVTEPDKHDSMAGQSYRRGYVKLDNGILIDIDAEHPLQPSDIQLSTLSRDLKHEETFQPVIGLKIVDMLLSDDYCGVCIVVESGDVIASVPGAFWIAPFLCKHAEFRFARAKSVW